MDLVMLLLVLAVVAAIAAIALGRLPGGMPPPSSTVPAVRLPDGPLTGQDLRRLRFVPALRGYRMDQVDDALDRLAREVDRLRALQAGADPAAEDQPVDEQPVDDRVSADRAGPDWAAADWGTPAGAERVDGER